MSKIPELSPSQFDQIPWIERNLGDIVYQPRYHDNTTEEKVIAQLKVTRIEMPPGETVREWLTGHLEMLETLSQVYRLTRGRDGAWDIRFEDKIEKVPPPISAEAQIVVLFRKAPHNVHRDGLMMLSDLTGKKGKKVDRREVVAVGFVMTDMVAIHVSPAVGEDIGVEKIAHEIFKQLASPGEDAEVVRAKRRKKGKLTDRME